MASPLPSLLVERAAPLLTLRLNSPERRNGLTLAMASALKEVLLEASADPNVWAIALAGSGGHFCSGLDLSAALTGALPTPEVRRGLVQSLLVEGLHPMLLALWECPKPTVALLSGATVGFGLSLALACDLRLMDENAYLQSGFLSRGLCPDGAVLFQLERAVGRSRALALALDPARRLTADEAQGWGLATCAAAGKLEEEGQRLLQRLAEGPPVAQCEVKRLAAASSGSLAAALAAEVSSVERCLLSDDALEGIAAFLERRPARFQGR